ncbi:MAG TPA: hypothetical protein VM536_16890, partial [Chloroflexia bacterium]|nr:hypothetical protein [Chloroflexia bacterium]
VRLRVAVEDHGAGRQLVRVRVWPRCGPPMGVAISFAALSGWAMADGAWPVAALLGGLAVLLVLRSLQECAAAMGRVQSSLDALAADASGDRGP